MLQGTRGLDTRIAGQLSRLNDLYVLGSTSREEYVGRKRELEASLNTGTGQPTYAVDVGDHRGERRSSSAPKKTVVSSTGECNAVTSVLSPEVSAWPRWVAQV